MRFLGLTTLQWLQILGLPLCFIIVGVLAKRLGKRDGDDSPQINDWAVGTSVLLMTFGKVAADLVDLSNHPPSQAQSSAAAGATSYWLLGILLLTFVSIEHDRFRSWMKDASGGIDKKKRLYVGVLLPNLVSFIVFASYQAGKV